MSEPTNIQRAGKKIKLVGGVFYVIGIMLWLFMSLQDYSNNTNFFIIIGIILTLACSLLLYFAGVELESKE